MHVLFHATEMKVAKDEDKRGEESGLGGAVMEHPAHGIRWVCKRFAPHGIGLEPGQFVLSGSFTRPVAVTQGTHIRADYGQLGEITLQF